MVRATMVVVTIMTTTVVLTESARVLKMVMTMTL